MCIVAALNTLSFNSIQFNSIHMLCDAVESIESECLTTGANCVRSCLNRRNGDYQSCNGCHVYVTCSSRGIHDNQPCPSGLEWNDNIKLCDWETSQTCECNSTSVNSRQLLKYVLIARLLYSNLLLKYINKISYVSRRCQRCYCR